MKFFKNIILAGEILLVVLLLFGMVSKIMGYDINSKEKSKNSSYYTYNDNLHDKILE
ncbi:hypothetical protein [Clostridium sp.]|uniref:hypothetical protein n=1 Tax=Clostridium sp. TaxID=1506 RepID=UPI0026080B60|nr:hypothetical protein [Clostridium sp.]